MSPEYPRPPSPQDPDSDDSDSDFDPDDSESALDPDSDFNLSPFTSSASPASTPSLPIPSSADQDFLTGIEADPFGWLVLLYPHIFGQLDSYPLAPHHEDFWRWLWAIKPKIRPRPYIAIWPRGGAKALALSTPLPTPTGWTSMRDVQVGDQLLDEQGRPCRVTATSAVESKNCYRIKFRGGGYIDASGDHLWTVLDKRSRRVMWRLHERIPLDWATWEHWDRPETSCDLCPAPAGERGPKGERWCGTHARRFKTWGNPEHVTRQYPRKPFRTLSKGRKRFASQILTTEEMLDMGLTNSASVLEYEWAIPVASGWDTPEVNLPLDPWMLGCWLGDGTSANGNITVGLEDAVEVRARMEMRGWTVKDRAHSNAHTLVPLGLRLTLQQMGLLRNKHVPSEYLRASTKQRIELLAGLCDTDGTVKRNGVSFSNTNKNLAESVHELAISLGYRSSIYERRATLYGKDCGPAWVVSIIASPHEVFFLSRKAIDTRHKSMQMAARLHIIKSIEKLPDQLVRCVVVDSPNHLFLAGRDAIPTHNSSSAESGVVALGARGIRHYCIYVSDAQDRADGHVQTIGDSLESEEMALWYPGMADRAVGKFGNWKGWRRNRLHTRSGFIVDALGLDVAARGLKVGVLRPDLLIFDDVDDSDDAPETVARKIESLTRRILPATTNHAAIIGIQNLIHRDSIFAQLADGRAPFLTDSIISGPIPAIRDLEYQSTIDPETSRTRITITSGTPTWPGLDIAACENEITKEGISVFLAELQHVIPDETGGMFDHISFRHAHFASRDCLVNCPGPHVPELDKVVCWVDPAVTNSDESDAMGIQIDGISRDKTLYRLWSWEKRATPLEAIRLAIVKAKEYGSSYVGIETDQGGDTWRSVYTQARDSLGPGYHHLTMRAVKAGQGYGSKVHRASQMLADYERCVARGTLIATPRGDIPIEQLEVGEQVWTREGPRAVVSVRRLGIEPTIEVATHDGRTLVCTPDHPVFVVGRGFLHGQELAHNDRLLLWQGESPTFIGTRASIAARYATAQHYDVEGAGRYIVGEPSLDPRFASFRSTEVLLTTLTDRAITDHLESMAALPYTDRSGRMLTDRFPMDTTSIILNMTQPTIISPTWTACRPASTSVITTLLRRLFSTVSKRDRNSQKPRSNSGPSVLPWNTHVKNAGNTIFSSISENGIDSVPLNAIAVGGIKSVRDAGRNEIWTLQVADVPEYFANGILTHNSMIVHVEGTHHILEAALIRFPRTRPLDLCDAAQWSWRDLRRLSRPGRMSSAASRRIPGNQALAVGGSGPSSLSTLPRGRGNLRVVPMPSTPSTSRPPSTPPPSSSHR